MDIDKHINFRCGATKYVEYKIPYPELEMALEALKNVITVDYVRSVDNDYWYVCGRYK